MEPNEGQINTESLLIAAENRTLDLRIGETRSQLDQWGRPSYIKLSQN